MEILNHKLFLSCTFMLMLLTACYTPRETTPVSNIDNSPSENAQIEKGRETEEKSLDSPRDTTNLTNGDNNDRSTKFIYHETYWSLVEYN